MGWTEQVRHFSPEGDPQLRDPDGTVMDERLMVLLDHARDELGAECHVTSGARLPAVNQAAGGADDSGHLIDPQGRATALDGYFAGLPLVEQFLCLVRYPFFGLGLYPYPLPGRAPKPWIPVFHVDRRERAAPFQRKVLWIRNAAGVYVYWPSAEFLLEFRALASGAA
jgi:hypothetical protein